jgi:hypothetical protein
MVARKLKEKKLIKNKEPAKEEEKWRGTVNNKKKTLKEKHIN